MTPFRVVGETTRVETAFLRLSDVEIEGQDGERFVRNVVRHPGAVVVVPLEADRRHAVLVRQFRAAVGRDLLEVPAGKRDVEGEPPEQTARRELEEEIGHRPGRIVVLCEFYNSPGFCDEYTYLYCALDLEELADRHAVREEEAAMTIERVALTDIESLVAARELVDAKSIIGLLLARQFVADHDAGGHGEQG